MSTIEGNEDLIVISKSETGVQAKENENIAEVEYYLKRKDINDLIKENWPELAERIGKIITPRISDHPDFLELEEAAKRNKRIESLSRLPALEALQSLLYEELFGVNDNPGQEISDTKISTPTPGGLISHGYLFGTFNGENIESVSKLPFNGDSAKKAVDSLSDYDQKNKLIDILSWITYPTSDFTSEHLRGGLRRLMQKEDYKTSNDINNWSYRLIQLFKCIPELSSPVEDISIIGVIMPKANREISFGRYWHILWSKMSPRILHQNESGVYFNNPDNSEVKEAIRQMLYVRVHPDTQFMFKYLSPSGYINEKKPD